MQLTKNVVNFLKREDGPTAVEYAVMLALIIVVCIGAVTTLGGNANAFVGGFRLWDDAFNRQHAATSADAAKRNEKSAASPKNSAARTKKPVPRSR